MPPDNPLPRATPESHSDRLILRPGAEPAGAVLVTIILRGGADGLYLFPAFGDPSFRALRGSLGEIEPSAQGMIDLDGYFGMHADLSRLQETYQSGHLAIVHGVGLSQPILSHFDATRAIEGGSFEPSPTDGWLGRHFASPNEANRAPLRAVAMGSSMPLVLQGANARLLGDLDDMRLEVPLGWEPEFTRLLARLYARGDDLAAVSGRGVLDTLAALKGIGAVPRTGPTTARYRHDRFGNQLRQVAQLIKAEVGLEGAVISLEGWDSHVQQMEKLAPLLQNFGASLSAFIVDLHDQLDRVTVVVLSEFGRRAAPNQAGGTDHGRAGAMLVLGGGIRGGQVYGRWPGLGEEQLDADGNLQVTTDYRSVLAEVLDRRVKSRSLGRVFPQFEPTYLGITG
ncbi:MAG TPA: DUF1501 domain-containing protein [Pirellulales bacterium]|jgi:uncharacterized protein (DUF1501 family)|nr:DUF1501 domain-containing protein [Pirellulales bacterium]